MLDPLFLSSGLFFGWSLGANDAANVWGPAVGARMVKFIKAALLCGLFVTLGSVLSGSGGSHTIGAFASVRTLSGAFIVTFSAALTVFWMTRMRMPVSNTHAVAGSIIAWNLFSATPVDYQTLYKIVGSWFFSPVLTGIFAALLYKLISGFLRRWPLHILHLDSLNRKALIIAGILGSYSLGANNIGNVIGVFVPVSPFRDIVLGPGIIFSSTQQLALIGGLSIGLGVLTYSKKVMLTVGKDIYKLSPLMSFVVILSSSLVLFLFASKELQNLMISLGLPAFPLVPISSSQSIVGGVLGIGLSENLYNINYGILKRIFLAWITTPVAAGLLSFLLFSLRGILGAV